MQPAAFAMGGHGKRRAAAAAASAVADPKAATGSELRLNGEAAVAVGAGAKVVRDYLDMEKVPRDDANDLEHGGYLVLQRGEIVRVLYVGGEPTGDTGWLYGEVLRSLRAEPVGRRGWFPDTCVRAPGTQVAPAGPAKELPKLPKSPERMQSSPPCRQGPPRAGTATKAAALSQDDFPLLVGQREGDGRASAASPHFSPGGDSIAPAELERDARAPTAAKAAEAIARQRAKAAEAAAAAAGNGRAGSVGDRCPICMESYIGPGGRRKSTRRPCCGTELCLQCDHKSLRSGRCYFCREGVDEFPSLALACRVASAS